MLCPWSHFFTEQISLLANTPHYILQIYMITDLFGGDNLEVSMLHMFWHKLREPALAHKMTAYW